MVSRKNTVKTTVANIEFEIVGHTVVTSTLVTPMDICANPELKFINCPPS
jgi:hypothetical protein